MTKSDEFHSQKLQDVLDGERRSSPEDVKASICKTVEAVTAKKISTSDILSVSGRWGLRSNSLKNAEGEEEYEKRCVCIFVCHHWVSILHKVYYYVCMYS